MDLKKGSEKLDAADGFLTKLKTILKKHWGLLILLLFGWFIYWALTTEPTEPVNNSNTKPVVDTLTTPTKQIFIIKMEKFVDNYGDTVYVDYYNDGYIDRYYSNGDNYTP